MEMISFEYGGDGTGCVQACGGLWEVLSRTGKHKARRHGTARENADQYDSAYLKQCPKNCEMIEWDTTS